MNTSEKGDSFEAKGLELITRAIEEERLGIMKECIRVFSKKGYYSDKRKKEIIFDLTIEVWPPGADKYTLLYIIECKDYATKIPVDDIEEFYAKIIQVSGVNVKGVFITNNGFQSGAYTYAESMGMMLIRGESANNYEILLHKKERKVSTIPTLRNIGSAENDQGIILIEQIIDKCINGVFKVSTSNGIIGNYNIPTLSKEDIESITKHELSKINPFIESQGRVLTKEKLHDYLKDELGVNINNLAPSSELLGSCQPEKDSIFIHPKLINTRRYLFVLAHELGHYYLHQNLTINQKTYDNFSDSEFNFETNKHDLTNPRHWIEWQANYFASSLIMPKISFVAKLYWCQQYERFPEGKIYVDDQLHNIRMLNKLVDRLSYFYDVTKTSVYYRLNELGMIDNHSHLKTVKQIIDEQGDNLFV